MTVTVHRKSHFNAAHRLYIKDWSEEKNKEIFGKCALPNYHGHNYEVIVGVTGKIDPETGFVINLDILKTIIQDEVEEYLDHKNLNLDIPEFRELNPTAENIVVLIWNRIKPHLSENQQLEVTLYETPRNYVSYRG